MRLCSMMATDCPQAHPIILGEFFFLRVFVVGQNHAFVMLAFQTQFCMPASELKAFVHHFIKSKISMVYKHISYSSSLMMPAVFKLVLCFYMTVNNCSAQTQLNETGHVCLCHGGQLLHSNALKIFLLCMLVLCISHLKKKNCSSLLLVFTNSQMTLDQCLMSFGLRYDFKRAV